MRILRGDESREPCRRALFVLRSPLRGSGLSRDVDTLGLCLMSRSLAILGDGNQGLAERLHVLRLDLKIIADAIGIGCEHFVVDALDLLHETCLMEFPARRDDPVGLCHLERGDHNVSLADAYVGDVTLEDFPLLDPHHVVIVGDVSLRLGLERNAGSLAESKPVCPEDDVGCADLEAHLNEPGVARLGERLDEIELSDIVFFPVVEGEVPDVDGLRTAVGILGREFPRLESGHSHIGLEGRSRRVGRAKGARQERGGGIFAHLPVDLGIEHGNEMIGIILRPGGHGVDLSSPRIDDDDGTLLAVLPQDFLADPLKVLVDRRDDGVTGNGGLHDALGGFPTLRVIGEVDASGLSLELKVKGLLDALPALALSEDEVLVLNGAHRERCLLARVPDDV